MGRGRDTADAVRAGSAGGLHGEPVAGLEAGPLGETPVDHHVVGGDGGTACGESEGREGGGGPGVSVRGRGGCGGLGGKPAGGLGNGHGEEGEFGDHLAYTVHVPDLVRGGCGEPGALSDGFRLVLDLRLPVALELDGGPVDILVGGDDERSRGIALDRDPAAQAGLQERAAGGDKGSGAHQSQQGAEEPALAVSNRLQGVAQHHDASVSLMWLSAARGGAGKASSRVWTVRAPGGVSASDRL